MLTTGAPQEASAKVVTRVKIEYRNFMRVIISMGMAKGCKRSFAKHLVRLV